MRRLLSGIALALLPAAVSAQAPPSARWDYVRVPEVEVRSGPSDKFPMTGLLRKGARVLLKNRADVPAGWLAIDPPEGSVSWVPKAVVTLRGAEVNGRQVFVVETDSAAQVPIHAGGRNLTDGPLEAAQKYEVVRGTQGYIRGNPVKPAWDDRKWYPIDPLPGEARYIPAGALVEPLSREVAARPRTAAVPGQLTSVPGRDANDLYRRARQADDAGRTQEAIDLYQEVAREVSATNGDMANLCATRVYELRQRRGAPAGAPASRGGEAPRAGGFTPPPEAPAPNNLRQSGAGFLRRTSFLIDNRPTYALVDRNRRVIYYVTPEPGINMEPYVERWVDLHGTVEVRGDVRGAEHMRVAKVFLLR